MSSWRARAKHVLKLVLKLGRLKMAVFSAVTYGTAASVANLALIEADSATQFDAELFLVGWAFVFFTQLVAHFLGEDDMFILRHIILSDSILLCDYCCTAECPPRNKLYWCSSTAVQL